MSYVFDSSSWRVMQNLYPDRFPSYWEAFEDLVARGNVLSVREALRELDRLLDKDHMRDWVEAHRQIFHQPTGDEMQNVARILAVQHFQSLIGEKARMNGWPVADPFVVASGMTRAVCVVTEEHKPDNGARIPNVCEHFNVRCINFEGFLEDMGWQF